MSIPSPAPGWYPDPNDPNRIRYWNGQQWSVESRTRPVDNNTPVQPVSDTPVSTQSAQPEMPAQTGLQAPSSAPAAGVREEPKTSAERFAERHNLTLPPEAKYLPREAFDFSLGIRRFISFIVDSLLCGILGVIFAIPMWVSLLPKLIELSSSGEKITQSNLPALTGMDYWWLTVSNLVVWFVYDALMVRLAKGTLGQLLMGVRVTSASTTDKQLDGVIPNPTWLQAIQRALVKSMVGTLAGNSYLGLLSWVGLGVGLISYLMMNRSRTRRSLFDRVGDTRVVFYKRG